MLAHLRPAVVMLALFTLLTGIVYPRTLTGLVQVIAPSQANGSLLMRNGTVVGSELIGQSFSSDGYFHPRLRLRGVEPRAVVEEADQEGRGHCRRAEKGWCHR